MKGTHIVGILVLVVALLGGMALLPGAQNAAVVAHGKYLVEQVAVCADCHSPRNQKGEFDKTKWFQGSVLFFKPIQPIPGWADTAPPLAGLPVLTEAQTVKLLETGLLPSGTPPRPPMPSFRLNQTDAVATAAYLKSLAKK